MDKEMLERIVKAVVAYNKEVRFSKRYLSYLDEFDLIVEEEEDTTKLSVRMKD